MRLWCCILITDLSFLSEATWCACAQALLFSLVCACSAYCYPSCDLSRSACSLAHLCMTEPPCSCVLQAQEMQEVNAKLVARAQSVEEKHNQMMQHVTQMNECLKQKTLDNERLQTELNLLKRSMKVRHFTVMT